MDWRGIDKGTPRGADKEKLIQNSTSHLTPSQGGNPKSRRAPRSGGVATAGTIV